MPPATGKVISASSFCVSAGISSVLPSGKTAATSLPMASSDRAGSMEPALSLKSTTRKRSSSTITLALMVLKTLSRAMGTRSNMRSRDMAKPLKGRAAERMKGSISMP